MESFHSCPLFVEILFVIFFRKKIGIIKKCIFATVIINLLNFQDVMKKILCASAFALLFFFFSCSNDETKSVPSGIPNYASVKSYLEQCGYGPMCVDSLGFTLDDYMPSGYVGYSAYRDTANNRILVPVCYDSNDEDIIRSAMTICEHIYLETYDKDGHKYISCYGEGQTCHFEISVAPGGEGVSVFIVTCS